MADHDKHERILILVNAMSNIDHCGLPFFEMELDIVHCTASKSQAADALLQLSITAADRTPVHDALHNILVVSSPNGDKKVCAECTGVNYDYKDNGLRFLSLGLQTLFSLMISATEANTTSPTLPGMRRKRKIT